MLMYPELTNKIIEAFFEVKGKIGPGLLEKCYHNALYLALQNRVSVVSNRPYNVYFNGKIVGEYFVDLVVEDKIIIEVKSVTKLSDNHVIQILNYLNISKCKLGFLVNFQNKRLEFSRFVL